MEQLELALEPHEGTTDTDSDGQLSMLPPPRPRKWTMAQLESAVASAHSLNGVFKQLQLTVGGSQWQVVRKIIAESGWSTAHWTHPLPQGKRGEGTSVPFRRALEDGDLEAEVAKASSRADVIRALGFRPNGTTYRLLALALDDADADTSHFDLPHAAMRNAPRRRYRRSLDEILVQDSTYTSTAALKRRLLDQGLLEPICAICGIDTWMGRPLVLHLDHVNGVRTDNRLENLRLLCPNCHSQTPTFAGRNASRPAR